MTPRAAIRAAAHSATTLRRTALALLLAATLLAGGTLAGPTPPASATALAVSAVAIQSSAGSDTQYHAGDDITIRVTFGTETITAHTGATIAIDVGGVNRTATAADVASGGANAYVDFTYTVTDSDRDTDGISVAAGTLGGTYTHTDPHTNIAFTQTVSASTSHRVNVNVTNYDRDGDGLIEINSLAQLNAIRYDLNGNGRPDTTNQIVNYAAAFPGRSESHGCPDTNDADSDPGPCIGYELVADLDFDTDGDGSTHTNGTSDSGDAYHNGGGGWEPIGTTSTSASHSLTFSGTFRGNGHTINNLFINRTPGAINAIGLFGRTDAKGRIETLGVTNAFVGTNANFMGVLVGSHSGTIIGCYVTGKVQNRTSAIGGMVGLLNSHYATSGPSPGAIIASYSTAEVQLTVGSAQPRGLLVGESYAGSISYSYATGRSYGFGNPGQLVGQIVTTGGIATPAITASYWDSQTTNVGGGQTTAGLQNPTGYTGIYENWNSDVDGVTGNDDPWDFGTASQYPVLKYASHDFAAQGRPFDYDADNDGLIDITTLAQLDAIRHDLDGNGDPAGAAGAAAFRKAFPHRVRSVAGRMGCQPTDHDSMPGTPDRATCTGYELMADLDFDTNGDGNVNSSDDYPNWAPIGANLSPYTAAFNGNGHTISNMTINTSNLGQVGLFAAANGEVIENVGLPDVSITASGSDSQLLSVGALAGYRRGAVRASYATGTISGTVGAVSVTTSAGGLVGYLGFTANTSQIDASWAAVNISVTSSSTATGPDNQDAAGGLVGRMISTSGTAVTVTSSWARGTATSSRPGSDVGGLVGRTQGTGVSVSGHWDTDTSNLPTSAGGSGVVGRTTTQLKMPTNYGASAGDTFFGWNIDVDGDSNNDDPWDFGTDSEYPVLAYGGHTLAAQGRTVVDYDDDNDGLIDIRTLAQLNAVRYDLNGDGDIATANAPAYRVAFPNGDRSAAGRMGCPLADHDSNADTPDQATCAGYELRANLNFDTDGDNTADAPYANWTPIPAYNTAFNGNGRTISNLNISGSGAGNAGLFAQLNGSGSIYAVGLLNPSVRNGGSVSGGTGALAGTNSGGSIYAVYARGGAVNSTQNDAGTGGLVGRNINGGTITASYATVAVNGGQYGFYARVGGLVGINYNGPTWSVGTINYSYAAGSVSGRTSAGTAATMGCLSGHGPTGSAQHGNDAGSYYLPVGCPSNGAGAAKTSLELRAEAGYDGIYADWNRNLDGDATTGDNQGRDDPWDFRLGHFPVLKYGGFDVNSQRPLLAEAGADAEAYSGQTVTLDGSGSRALGGGALTYTWAPMPDGDEGDPTVTLTGDNTASPTFMAPTGLTSDITLKFRLTVTAAGQQSVYDEVVVTIIAVRPNQLLSLSLTDPEGDAVSLAPSFLSLRYDYQASVANQIASVTVTPRVLSGSTMTLNGQAVTSGAEVEVPLKYRGNEITIVVTPPEPEPDETMNGETADGETADETVEETPCSVENDGVKPCTYTITVRRAVPPRLAFVPRSLTIDEGGTGTYTVALDTRILTGAVTVAIASDNPAVTISPTEVTLKPLDMAPRTITVTAAADADRDDENVVITHTANGAHYYDVIATVGVTVNDTTAPPPAPDPALSVSATALRLTEGGSGAYTVALATRPADNVTVTIASNNPDVTTRPASLSFTTANWNTAQRVTVSAASDGDTANDAATLTHTASGGGYGDAPAVQVTVSVTDDDTAGLAITPTVLNLIENGISAFIVSLTAQPSGNVTVSIASDNPDVTVRPTALTFTPTNWATSQAVLVITRADAGGGDELATLRMTAQGGGYAGQTGQVLASVDDTLAPLPVNADAPAGVSVYGPPGTTARATVSPPAADTPTVATSAGFGIGPAVAVSVSDSPDDGLEICLPVSDALRAEAGSALVLTLLRYAAGSWTELSGARDLGDRVCAAGATGQAAYAAAYALRPGTVLDLVASVGDDPGTIELSWTPPAAGASQVAVVVNAADDTDYCLDTLPGLDASSYTCAGRTAGQTYVTLLIVLLPDGGYTLANIVRFELPAAGGQ